MDQQTYVQTKPLLESQVVGGTSKAKDCKTEQIHGYPSRVHVGRGLFQATGLIYSLRGLILGYRGLILGLRRLILDLREKILNLREQILNLREEILGLRGLIWAS